MTTFAVFVNLLARAIDDAKHLAARRLTIAAILGLVAIMLDAYVFIGWHSYDALGWIEIPMTLVLSFLIYADAMRAVLFPEYILTLGQIVKLSATSLILFALVALCGTILEIVMAVLHLGTMISVAGPVMFFALLMFFAARFAFACILLKDHGVWSACLRSWTLTGPPTFMLTLLFVTVYNGAWFLAYWGIDVIRSDVQPMSWIALSTTAHFIIVLLACSYIFPFWARWMLECERFHTPAAPAVAS